MSGISAENVARLTSADRESLRAAVEAVLYLSDAIEDDDEDFSRSSRLLARRFRLVVEENLT